MSPMPKNNMEGYMEPGRDVLNHNHAFLTNADVADEHQHMIVGTTGPAIPQDDSHIHRICVRTSYDPKCGEAHWHLVKVCTGPALDTPDGLHTHFYCGETSEDLDHCHDFSSVTDTSPEMIYEEEEEEDEEDMHEHCGYKYPHHSHHKKW